MPCCGPHSGHTGRAAQPRAARVDPLSDVVTAVDGKDGLVKLEADPGIRLVVADVNMPNMDGLTMVEKIRSELRNSTVNLIMLTTESSPNMKERGKAAGVKGWIVKPFKGPAVLETFKKLVA
jgi:two-component system chemotaxis response regulator CheY